MNAAEKRLRETVWERDNGRCVGCGINRGLDWQHIQARKAGGSRDPFIASVANRILLCRAGCHRACENRDESMRARGYWRHSWETPGPVRYPDGVWYVLDATGGRQRVESGAA